MHDDDIEAVEAVAAGFRVRTKAGQVMFVPDAPGNRDRLAVDRWLQAGGKLEGTEPRRPRRSRRKPVK